MEMKYLIIVPAVIAACAVALYVWAVRQPNPFLDWEGAYD